MGRPALQANACHLPAGFTSLTSGLASEEVRGLWERVGQSLY